MGEMEHKTVNLKIYNRGFKGTKTPVTVGIPFSEDWGSHIEALHLMNERGEEVPFQHDVTAKWVNSGSIKWVLFDFQVEDLDKKDILDYTLHIDDSDDAVNRRNRRDPLVNPSGPDSKVTVIEKENRFIVDTGRLLLTVNKKGCGIIDSAYLINDINDSFKQKCIIPENSSGSGAYMIRADGEAFYGANDSSSKVTRPTLRR